MVNQHRSPLNFWLRAFQGNWDCDAAAAATIRFLRAANFQGIMFWWGHGHWEPNHVADAEMKARARRIARLIPMFRKAGFSTGLNIHTIGFTYSPPDARDFGFQYQVGNDSAPNRNSACPLCPAFHRYLDRLFTAFALAGLEYVFVDDDFDYMVPGSSCFCPLHMQAFSKEVGQTFRRERWLETMRAADFKPGDLSEAWRKVQTGALLGAAQIMERALHHKQPNTRLGPMGINGWICNRGIKATNRLLEICRGPNHVPPVVRPSVGAYWDWQRCVAHGATSHHSEIYLRTILPDDATRFIELDSGAPWTIFDHGTEHLSFVVERSVATGAHDFAFLLFPDNPKQAIPKNHPYTEMLRKNRARFEAIAGLVGENPVFEGVDCRTGAGFGVDPRHDHFFGIASFTLARIGLALAPTGEWVTVLFGKQPWIIGKERLADHLTDGAMIDAGALEAIMDMSCSDLVAGARVADWADQFGSNGAMSAFGTPVGLEMSRHRLNGSAAGQFFSNLGGLRKQCRKLVGRFRDGEVLSWWVDPALHRLGPAEVAIEREGRRFVLLAHRLDHQSPDQQILGANPLRQEMFHNACEWIARRPLPAVIKDGADVHLFCMRSRDGKRRILTLANHGFNRFEELTIEIGSLPRADCSIRTIIKDGSVKDVSALRLQHVKDRWRLRLPEDIVPGPMEVRLLVLE